MQLSPEQQERSMERNILSRLVGEDQLAYVLAERESPLEKSEGESVTLNIDGEGIARACPFPATSPDVTSTPDLDKSPHKDTSNGCVSGVEDSASDFQSLAEQLTDSYAELAIQVTELSDQLDAAKAAREQELIEKERLAHRLTALLDSLPGGVLVLDRHHTVILANPIAVDMLGEPLLNMNFLSVIGEVARSIAADGKQIVMNNGRRVTISNQTQDEYGDQIVLLTDVTDAYEAQAADHRRERLSALGEMVARLAHQIRTPLASALLYVGALKRPLNAPSEQAEIADKIRDRLKHLEQLVDDSLDYVRGGGSEMSECSLFELLDALKASVEPVLLAQGGNWSEKRPGHDVLLIANQEGLLSALTAIAENGLQMSDAERPALVISAELVNDGLAICIADNGPGVDEAAIERIFDPFYTTRTGGTGLGLALAAMISRNHDAKWSVANQESGGAAFTLLLPLSRVLMTTANQLESMLAVESSSKEMKHAH